MTFDREMYVKACQRVRNTPLYRADCPPEDELGSLEDDAIEQITQDIIDEAIESPDYMAEILLEVDYENTAFQEMVKTLCAMMSDHSFDSITDFGGAMREFIEIRAGELAVERLESE